MVELIDPDGRHWLSTDTALAKSLGGTLTGDNLARYAVMNLGFVSIKARGRFIRLACRPAILEQPAIVSTMHFVHDHWPATIGFDYFTQQWNHLIIGSMPKFQSMLFSLTSPRFVDNLDDRLLSKRISGHSSPHRRKISAVRRIFNTSPDLSDVSLPLDKLFDGRWSLHEVDNETGHSIVRGIGRSYTPFNPAWFAAARGRSLCSYSDEGYGLWVAQHHREALDTDQPIFDEVDAILGFPSLGDVRVCYSRLALAVTVRDQTRLVLSAAVSDSGIDLRSVSV
jgi:hypothetical protein